MWTLGWRAALLSQPSSLPFAPRERRRPDSWVPGHCEIPGRGRRRGAMDMQGLLAAREGRPGRQPPARALGGGQRCAGGWSWRGRALSPWRSRSPLSRVTVQTRARRLGTQGPAVAWACARAPGRGGRGDSCPPGPPAPLGAGIPSTISRGWCALRCWSRGGGRATTEPIGLGPSVPVLPGAHLPGTMPPFGAAVLDPWEGTDPVSSPTRWFCRLGRERAVEWGRGPGPEQHDDTATTVCAGWRAALPAPGRQPAPPQHQGSREALPRHRLSLRCQALWMRLRASSNFLLEAS